MIKKNRRQIILSSLVVLLPMLAGVLLWNDLPDRMVTHWGADGAADGFGAKGFAVFGVPCILLATHLLCVLLTLLDQKQKEQNAKALGMTFWIFPVVSLLTNGMMYQTALGKPFELETLMPVLLGVLFLMIGNYLPKVKQNQTLGIRISWTLHNEENWNKTHRLAGKIWVAAGLVLIGAGFLPLRVMAWAVCLAIAAMAVIPIAYSYGIYKQHQKQGIVYAAPPKTRAEKIVTGVATGFAAVLLLGVAVLMVTGDITTQCGDTSLSIKATYWPDAVVAYTEVNSVAYRTDLDVGVRTNGFGSPRLSMGTFRNDAFGSYTLYAYTGAKEYVVLTSDGETLVIGLRDAADTRALYETLKEKTGQCPGLAQTNDGLYACSLYKSSQHAPFLASSSLYLPDSAMTPFFKTKMQSKRSIKSS